MELFKVFESAKEVYKEQDFLNFIKAIAEFVRVTLVKMKNFIPKDAEDAFNFISDNFFGVFRPSQKKSEVLGTAKNF